jgi:hypothetical protein
MLRRSTRSLTTSDSGSSVAVGVSSQGEWHADGLLGRDQAQPRARWRDGRAPVSPQRAAEGLYHGALPYLREEYRSCVRPLFAPESFPPAALLVAVGHVGLA